VQLDEINSDIDDELLRESTEQLDLANQGDNKFPYVITKCYNLTVLRTTLGV